MADKDQYVSRKHHYLPVFYLVAFTPSGRRNDSLWVFDQKELRQYQESPKKVAFERDFYRIETPNDPPDKVEKALGEIESKAAPLIRRILETRSLPQGGDWEILLYFIALMAGRVPGHRKHWNEQWSEMMKKMMQMNLSRPERFQAWAKEMEEKGEPVGITYEQMRRFAEEGKYTIQWGHNWDTWTSVAPAEPIFRSLIHRKWSIAIAINPTSHFICSDCPVSLTWKGKPPIGIFSSPGFGLPDTLVTVPLSKEVALFASYEDDSRRVSANRKSVAEINSLTACHSNRYLFSDSPDFFWKRSDGQVCGPKELSEAIRTDREGDAPKTS